MTDNIFPDDEYDTRFIRQSGSNKICSIFRLEHCNLHMDGQFLLYSTVDYLICQDSFVKAFQSQD